MSASKDSLDLPSLDRLQLTQDERRVIVEFFNTLGADADFIGYPSLTPVARNVLLLSDVIGLPGEALRASFLWGLTALTKALASVQPALPDRASGACAARYAKRYPIICALFSPVEPGHKLLLHRLRALLVSCALMHVNTAMPPAIEEAANELRLSAQAGDERLAVLENIPELLAVELSLSALAWRLESLRGQARTLTKTQQNFLQRIARMVRLTLSRSVALAQEAPRVRCLPLDVADQPAIGGTVECLIAPDASPVPWPPEEEAPEPTWGFREQPTADPISYAGLQGQAHGSRYWLAAAARALPWARSVISPVQIASVLNSLRSLCQQPQGAPARWIGTLLALLLATGLDLDEISALQLAPGGDLDLVARLYRRHPPTTEKAGPRDSDASMAALAAGSHIDLPLPEVVQQLLPPDYTGPLLLWLQAQNPHWQSELATYLTDLQPTIPSPPTPSRISKLLGGRLQQRYDDIALTFLLTGRKGQAVPIDLYYATLPASRLITAYQDTVATILPPPC